jgi:hypothetical protein
VSYATLSLPATVDLVCAGIQSSLEEAIFKALAEHVKPVIRQAAVDAAKNIVTKVDAYKRIADDRIELLVRFNEVDVA